MLLVAADDYGVCPGPGQRPAERSAEDTRPTDYDGGFAAKAEQVVEIVR
jgi:hypothetical protein